MVTVLSIRLEFNCIYTCISPFSDCRLRREISSQPLCHQHMVNHVLSWILQSRLLFRGGCYVVSNQHVFSSFSKENYLAILSSNWSLQGAKCNFDSSVLTCVQPGQCLTHWKFVTRWTAQLWHSNAIFQRRRYSPWKLLVTGNDYGILQEKDVQIKWVPDSGLTNDGSEYRDSRAEHISCHRRFS